MKRKELSDGLRYYFCRGIVRGIYHHGVMRLMARPLALAFVLSACAPTTVTLQAQCAGFGYTAPADIAGCTERRHDKALDRQYMALRMITGAVSAGMLADALTGLELPQISPVIDLTLPPMMR